ncbi:hypothetical protein HMPREF1979_02962 [Actinomyces johnsonii F0542]|uniref:Uncharacterized protein n=1 Tax=Actinomyces johnsonii F0542 TaxID=1321818 RepID=U1QIM5_9ACTO|nr:hypothetical protein HMPREF1979_02962 [Actinomyces johnsonii F0542]
MQRLYVDVNIVDEPRSSEADLSTQSGLHQPLRRITMVTSPYRQDAGTPAAPANLMPCQGSAGARRERRQ